jgi:hypothetical protein
MTLADLTSHPALNALVAAIYLGLWFLWKAPLPSPVTERTAPMSYTYTPSASRGGWFRKHYTPTVTRSDGKVVRLGEPERTEDAALAQAHKTARMMTAEYKRLGRCPA